MVGHARDPGVHVAAAQLLGRDHLAGRGLHQRRPAEEDRALLLDDDRLVRHRRHVGAAGRAGAHDHGDLRDALGRHGRLIVEDAAEIVPVGEDLVLVRQVGAAGVDQVDAGQPVLARHLLRPQMLLHRHRVVGAALDRGVVDDDHAFAARDAADAGDDPGRRHLAAVHAVRRELAELQERRAGVEQPLQPLARQQLAARRVLRPRRRVAAQGRARHLRAQVGDHRLHLRRVLAEGVAARVQPGLENAHAPTVPPPGPTALPAGGPMLHSSSLRKREEMALNIKSAETDRLARELAALTGESITEAVTRAMEARLDGARSSRDSREELRASCRKSPTGRRAIPSSTPVPTTRSSATTSSARSTDGGRQLGAGRDPHRRAGARPVHRRDRDSPRRLMSALNHFETRTVLLRGPARAPCESCRSFSRAAASSCERSTCSGTRR